MNAVELYLADGRTSGAFYCGKCRIIHREKQLADECCQARICVCGAECERYYTKCPKCVQGEREFREHARFEKAEKLTETEWNGPVVMPDSDQYFASVSDMLDEVDSDDLPEYVWTCTERPVCELEIGRIIENATDDAYEDFESDSLLGQKELKTALDAFNEANKGNVVWEADHKLVVILHKP